MSDKEKLVAEEYREMPDAQDTRSRSGVSGLLFVGFLIIGLAVGFFIGNIPAGLFGGMGIGFIAMAIARYSTGEW